MHERSLVPVIAEDLASKMVFISGPRQVGKTTIAKAFAARNGIYLTWDDLEDREIIKRHKIEQSYKTVKAATRSWAGTMRCACIPSHCPNSTKNTAAKPPSC